MKYSDLNIEGAYSSETTATYRHVQGTNSQEHNHRMFICLLMTLLHECFMGVSKSFDD